MTESTIANTTSIGPTVSCKLCHKKPTGVFDTDHIDTLLPAEVTFGSLATGNGATPTWDGTACASTYCHDGREFKNAWSTAASMDFETPDWDVPMMSDEGFPPGNCDNCHGYPPPDTTAHSGGSATDCSSCHGEVVNADDQTFANKELHIDGEVLGGGDCDTCHNASVASPVAQGLGGPATRRAMMSEFGATNTHDSGADKFDCGVCHMEGTVTGSGPWVTDGSADSGAHKDGYVDLRDPDTGNQITDCSWSGSGAGSYSCSGTSDYLVWARNLGSNTLETFAVSTMINQCLKCHDGTSQVYASGGSTTNPFATGTAPPNIAGQFSTSNTSYHPILGKQNNALVDTNTANAPWDMADRGAPSNTTWGYLMTCFDCHDVDGASGSRTTTAVAHGGATNVRGTVTPASGAATALCTVCHMGSIYWDATGAVHADTQTVSAMQGTTSNRHSASSHTGCMECHGNGNGGWGNPPTQAERAMNAHGFDQTSPYNAYSFLRMACESWVPSTQTCGGVGSGGGMCGYPSKATDSYYDTYLSTVGGGVY
jgi:hypothetical protein